MSRISKCFINAIKHLNSDPVLAILQDVLLLISMILEETVSYVEN